MVPLALCLVFWEFGSLLPVYCKVLTGDNASTARLKLTLVLRASVCDGIAFHHSEHDCTGIAARQQSYWWGRAKVVVVARVWLTPAPLHANGCTG